MFSALSSHSHRLSVPARFSLLGGVLALLALALTATVLVPLCVLWRDTPQLSHGGALWLLAGALVWRQKAHLTHWRQANPAGFAVLVCAALLHIGAVWADVAFLKPLSFLAIAAGGIVYLGGWGAWRASGGALGLLVFTLPWPTLLVEAVAFPLQLISSAYAALLGGLLGLPLVRNGVELAVVPDIALPPIYSIRVAAACSGLTSLMVLLAVAYIVAYFTPAHWLRRVALVGVVVPLAVLTNAVRLTVILFVGAYHSRSLATWVHDHEQPVLVFFCVLGLLGVRHLLLLGQGQAAAPTEAAP